MPSGYTISEELYRGSRHAVHRAVRDADGRPVIIKSLLAEVPSRQEVAGVRREYEILSALDIEGVVGVQELCSDAGSLDLVLEDAGGLTLAAYIHSAPFDLAARLRIALRLAEVLAALHRAGVVHKDVTPRNVLVRPDTGDVTLIDFSISSRQAVEHDHVGPEGAGPPSPGQPRPLEGTPAYLSPEQTGRMNRPVDHRTDFYSLGVTLFELFSGRVPFDADDSMGLVHCHLAVPPPRLDEVQPGIPGPVCAVVHRLLQKAPEDRYQGGRGIVEDLRACLERLEGDGGAGEFVAGRRDVPDRFTIPHRLYGREPELEALLDAFERVGKGSTELVLVSGYSGIGKSSVVEELRRPIVERGGHFVSGKFDQLRRTVPYSAVAAAITGLVRRLLTGSDRALSTWKERLDDALGGNGQVVVDVIPDVERIIGPQPPVEELPGPAARDRFNTTFQAFIRAVCDRAHPLVVFLDDLQWADAASLALVDTILNDEDIRHLLVIGAYRDNEVDDAHPLTSAVEAIEGKRGVVTELRLAPLDADRVAALLADTLHATPEEVGPLQRLVSGKTGGNPFFLRQFLITLWRGGQLAFDHEAGRWTWDVERIAAMNITDNIVDLMMGRLEELPAASRSVLRLAACIGNEFDLPTLEIIDPDGGAGLLAGLRPALEAGLVVAGDGAEPASYRFRHDRIHQAAYSLIEDSLRRTVHLSIGRRLLDSVDDAADDDRLFEIVDHLNVGRELVSDPDELDRLARLNLAAARRAISATAYRAALDHATRGLACTGEDLWVTDPELARALHRVRADAAYLSGDFEESERIVDEMLRNVDTDVERAELHDLLVVQRTLSGRYGEAVETAVRALALLGIDLPGDDLDAALHRELEACRVALGDRRPADLLDAPEATSRKVRVALQLLASVCPLCYIADPGLCHVATARLVRLTLEHGHTPDSAIGYAFFGLVHSAVLHDFGAAHEFGRLAIALSERYGSPSQLCRTTHVFCAFIHHWNRPLREFAPLNSDGFHAGVQSGELQFAGYHRYNRALCLFHQGHDLDELGPELEELERFSRKTRNQHATDPIVGVRRVVLDLTAGTPAAGSFDAEGPDDRAFLDDLRGRNAGPALCHYNVIKSQALYLYGRLDEARRCAAEARRLLPFVSGHASVAVQSFYESLILAALAGDGRERDDRDRTGAAVGGGSRPAGESSRDRTGAAIVGRSRPVGERSPDLTRRGAAPADHDDLLGRLQDNQRLMETWAASCPANYGHKLLLVEAERARLAADHWRAADLYDRAIDDAGRNGYRQEESLARELAGRFWLERGRRKVAAVYLREAHHGYRLWGASRKAELMERRHGDLLAGAAARRGPSRTTMPYLTLVSSTGAALDFATIMKAARTISGEIELPALVEKLVRIAVENAGAQRGCLLLRRDDEVHVEAESDVTGGDAGGFRLTPGRPLDDAAVASSVVNYVVRTRETVVVADAPADPTFGSDPHVRRRGPRSILCVPIVMQTRLLGLLYLEHGMAADVFTEDRVGVVQGLAAQAAVSLENAGLYEEQRQTERRLRETLAEVERLKGRLEAENLYLKEEIELTHSFQGIIGESPAIRDVLEAVETVAPTGASVLVTGETGTGKELIARAVHDLSDRRDRPLIKVNCASVPRDLFESEFFGHEKGAFTGALKSRAGRFELADGGTLFLDEVAEIPLEMQSKLLRVLQEGQFERVGGERTMAVDVRIIAATNRDLDREVEEGRFRQDLYYRLNVFPVHVPPLRQRRRDIPLLAAHFVQRSATEMKCPVPALGEDHVAALQAYDWPGNIRELQNLAERAVIAARTGTLRFDLPGGRTDEARRGDRFPRSASGREDRGSGSGAAASLPGGRDGDSGRDGDTSLAALERDHILGLLEANDGNKAKTARDLGVDRKTLYSRLRDYGVLPARER